MVVKKWFIVSFIAASMLLSGVTLAEKTLLNVSYDPTRELYQEFNVAFIKYWQSKNNEILKIEQSHGGSGKQARSVIDSLKRNHLGGVALDVYEEEEGIFFEDHSQHVLQDDELNLLLTFPNVLITSHQAFLTQEALNEIARVTIDNILQFVNGRAIYLDNQLC